MVRPEIREEGEVEGMRQKRRHRGPSTTIGHDRGTDAAVERSRTREASGSRSPATQVCGSELSWNGAGPPWTATTFGPLHVPVASSV